MEIACHSHSPTAASMSISVEGNGKFCGKSVSEPSWRPVAAMVEAVEATRRRALKPPRGSHSPRGWPHHDDDDNDNIGGLGCADFAGPVPCQRASVLPCVCSNPRTSRPARFRRLRSGADSLGQEPRRFGVSRSADRASQMLKFGCFLQAACCKD